MVVAVVLSVPLAARAADGDVAQIGDTTYATLDAAISAAKGSNSGEVIIELLADATTTGIELNGGKDLAIVAAEGAQRPKVAFEGNEEGTKLGIALWQNSELTFQGVDVSMYEVHSTPYVSEWSWMSICLSKGSALTLDNATLTMDDNGDRTEHAGKKPDTGEVVTYEGAHAIYLCGDNELNLVNGAGLTIRNYVQDAVEWNEAGKYSINISGSTYLSDNNRSGFTGTLDITIEDKSIVSVNNSSGNGSNGSNYYISGKSTVLYSNNGGHGISASDLTIEDSTVTSTDNSYYGVYVNGDFLVDITSKLTVSGNSDGLDAAGLKIRPGVTDGKVEKGAIVTITDNYCSGLSNNGKVEFEEGAKLTITGNTNKWGGAHGGGVYNSGPDADLTLPSDAVIYNNHALTDGDDIYNSENSKIAFGKVGDGWKLDGVDNDGVADDCYDAIDGWYDDSDGNRWEAHAQYLDDNHIELFDEFNDGVATVTEEKALKAAHRLMPIQPDDPALDGWDISKSKKATNLDENYQSRVTLSLPADSYSQTMDVVLVFDDTSSTSEIFESSAKELLGELSSMQNLDVNVGIVAFDAVARDWLSVTSGGEYKGLVSLKDANSLAALNHAIETQLTSDGDGEAKRLGGSNTEWPVAMATEMLLEGKGEDKHLVMFSDMYGYVYRGSLSINGVTYNDVPLSKRLANYKLGQLCISAPMYDTWAEVYAGRNSDLTKYDSFFRDSTWKDYWATYQGDGQIPDLSSYNPETAPQYDPDQEGFVPYVYFTPFEKSLCMTYDNIQTAVNSGINVSIVNNDFNPGDHGDTIRSIKNEMLNALEEQGLTVITEETKNGGYFSSDEMDLIFSRIKDELVQLVDKGSYVIDEMGNDAPDGVSYDFDFVSDENDLTLTVNDVPLTTNKIESDDATAAYEFADDEGVPQFSLKYYKNGTTIEGQRYEECFVWEIDVPVTKDAPVDLTYTVKLVNPQEDEGTYGTYDEYGENGTAGLFTNNSATLVPVDSLGNTGVSQLFRKPSVSYEIGSAAITPADITIYMNGEDGYEGVVDDDQMAGESSNELPEPGFYITLPEFVNQMLVDAGLAGEGTPANLSDIMSITATGNDGTSREWTLKPYGEDSTTSSASRGYIYRVIPAEGQDPIRLEFTDDAGNTQVSDTFDPSDALYNNYDMNIYAGGTNMSTVKVNIVSADKDINLSLPLEPKQGELTIRYVTSESQNDTVSEVLEAENGEATTEQLAQARQANPTKGFAVLDSNATYYVNESTVEVTPDGQYHDAKPSLLFDDIVAGENGALENELVGKAVQTIAANNGTLGSDYEYEAKYLDLVDANNGNTWLTTNSPVTVYWPYPGETTTDTDFYLVHVHDLDRDMGTSDVIEQIGSANAEYIAIDDAAKTDYGISFTLEPDENGRVSFSPFVLVWGTKFTGPGPSQQYGNLTVEKTVTGDLADKSDEFSFTVTLSGSSIPSGEKTYGDVTFNDGKATFTLKDGQSVSIKGVPSGTRYTVEETDAKGYDSSSTGATGTIAANSTKTASFVNDKSTPDEPETLDPTDPVNPGGSKVLLDADGNPVALAGGEFTFKLTGLDGAPMPAGAVDGSITVTNRADGVFVFGDIVFDEAGTYTYELTEVAGTDEGITYDGSTHTLVVVVSDEDADGDGKLDIASLTYDGESTLPTFTNETTSDEPPTLDPDQSGTDEPAEPTTPGVPDTGDRTVSALPAVLALGGVALVGGALAVARRRVR